MDDFGWRLEIDSETNKLRDLIWPLQCHSKLVEIMLTCHISDM